MSSEAAPRRRRHYIMIGAPVTAVRTPPLLSEWFADQGIEARIDTRHVAAEDLASFMETVRVDPGIDGLLVTMPHKRAILSYLDRLSGAAERTGSVNAVKRADGNTLIGAQFDGLALVAAVESGNLIIDDARIVLAGLGGAGLAIAEALVERGCRLLQVCDADPDREATVLGNLQARGAAIEAVRVGEAGPVDLLINATPLGMVPDDANPFPVTLVQKAACVADIVADPPETKLAALAKRRGIPLVTGRAMVAAQVPLIGSWLNASESEPKHKSASPRCPPAGNAL
ncbi:MAG: hypothetical protein AAGL24_20580 [Pseudomonadota bacterium]